MRTLSFRTLFTMSALAMLAACSQEEGIESVSDASSNSLALTISANSLGFESADPTARATEDNNHATVFENGDQMGLFVIENPGDEGKLLLKNIPLTYDGSKWTAASNIYYYENADYVAYFPYSNALSVSKQKTDEVKAAIKAAFDGKLTAQNGTADTYRAADLMVASIDAASLAAQTGATKNLTFNLAHQYSLVEVKVPVHQFSYPVVGEGENPVKTYSIPMVNFSMNVKQGDAEAAAVTPCEVESGVYRYLVDPATVKVSGKFMDPSDNRPVNFAGSEKALASGKYIRYNVSYEGAPTGVQSLAENDLIGCYYYKNTNTGEGIVWPKSFTSLPTAANMNCLGIIFDTVGEEIPNSTWKYYVMSLGREMSANQWGKDESAWGIENYPIVSDYKEAFDDKSGYTSTQKLMASVGEGETLADKYPTLYLAITDFVNKKAGQCGDIVPPEGTSGYFLPAAGQLMAFYNNVGQPSGSYSPLTKADAATERSQKIDPAAFQRINEAIAGPGSRLGGVFVDFKVNTASSVYATTSLYKNENGDKKYLVPFRVQYTTNDAYPKCWLLANKTYAEKQVVRPVFAF